MGQIGAAGGPGSFWAPLARYLGTRVTVSNGAGYLQVGDSIQFAAAASGTIDLGGNIAISFQNIEQIVYTDVL